MIKKARGWRWITAALAGTVAVAVAATAMAWSGEERERSGRVPVPALPAPQGEECIEDADTMRRQHMHILDEHKRDSVRKGVRRPERDLQACVDCHAVREPVIADQPLTPRQRLAFCANCHSYSAVSLDCFACHSSEPGAAVNEGNDE